MDSLPALLALKARLPRTWPAFFERYGSFTATQVAAIPVLLDGQNIMLCAPTAGGKTIAAVAPLVERFCPPVRPAARLSLLYVTPTRALANDLAQRLRGPLETLGLTLGVKTGDRGFRAGRPPDLLITTPESTDSLLTTQARLFIHLRAIVLDELHLFDESPRGDQLRVLLNRIRRIRAYAADRLEAPDASIQYAALSATAATPELTAARYFAPARIVRVPGTRALEAEWIDLDRDDGAALTEYLATFPARRWRKALVFCNSRAEVEAYAAVARGASPFGNAVYVHYSNIEPRRRREIERQFAADEAALCFSSSTLELGIDIGDIDIVILIGPPGSPGAFAQRIGRGNRRNRTTRVACGARTPLERLVFEALIAEEGRLIEDQETSRQGQASRLHLDDDQESSASAPRPVSVSYLRPAVAIQQIFSLIKQSPMAAVRLAELEELFAGMLSKDDLQQIVGELQQRGYLKIGRPGEWRAGLRLNELYDEQTGAQPGLSVHSNIQASAPTIVVRDQHTGQALARVDALWLDRDLLTLEGRPVSVEWCDGEALWVSSGQSQSLEARQVFRSSRQLLSYELAHRLQQHLGLAPDAAPFVVAPEGWHWFHWLGDLYGRAALGLLRYHVAAQESGPIGLCLNLPDEPRAPPAWTEAQVVQYLQDSYRSFEPLLALGPFQQLLPIILRRRAVVEQFDVPRFLAAVTSLRPILAPESLAMDLRRLLE
jgi:ATP-dependent Lhr-like helicase